MQDKDSMELLIAGIWHFNLKKIRYIFENIAIEDLDACINSEVQAGVSEVRVYYAFTRANYHFSQCHWT
jgi:hypothetical protein